MSGNREGCGWLGAARLRAVAALGVLVPVGFAAKAYRGPSQWWINNWGSSFAYEIFFMLLAFAVVCRHRTAGPIAVAVCVATCVLEFAQLWTPPWLVAVRSTFIGQCVLGNVFAWWDLPAYPIGCVLGYLLLRRLSARTHLQEVET